VNRAYELLRFISPVTRTAPDLLRFVYAGTALSGFTALGAQVVWTRLLTLLFGATVYVFAIILAVFLAGLGIGSALAAYLLRRGHNALRGLAWSHRAPSLGLALPSAKQRTNLCA
jgi:hypothetical protein